jgi:hypothetical protein
VAKINSKQFISRFGGVHGKANAQRYGIQPHPAGAVRPSMDYGQAPTMNHYGLNSSGSPSDASAPTPNNAEQNLS